MSRPSIVHIGGNKTASTSLQRRLFAKHPAIRYLGEDCEGYAELKPLLDSLVADDDSHFDFGAAERVFTERFSARGEHITCVYSNEDVMTSSLPSVCAARLTKLVPGAQVVMVVRNQLTTWPSWYANHGAYLKNVPRRYWRRHVGLEEWLEYCFNFPNKTPVEAMNYERFYTIFQNAFGHVHVFLYEELLADPAAYYKRWADLLRLSREDVLSYVGNHVERRRYSNRRVCYDRWTSRLSVIPGLCALESSLQHLLPSLSRWLDDGPPARIVLPDNWAQKISDYYRSSNKKLAGLTGLDLARHGYPL